MKVEPLSEKSKEYAKSFTYKSSDDSLWYNYIISPALNKSIWIIPVWVAPNLITLLSLAFNIFSFALTAYEAQCDFTKKLSPVVSLIQAIAHYLYIILDNLDGKQARRTGTSSPFGMLLDHGCDVFTNIIVGFNVSHLLCLGQDTVYPLFCFVGLYIGFYATTHEGFVLGELHFAKINGADEGNAIVATGALIGSICGNGIWTIPITMLSPFIDINVGQLIITFIFISSVLCALESLSRIYFKKGLSRLGYALSMEYLPFYNIIILPFLFYFFSYSFYQHYFWLIMLCISSLFARLVIDMQIRVCVNQELAGMKNVYVMIGNILLLAINVFPSDAIKIAVLSLTSFAFFFELICIINVRGHEIMDVLGIKLLTINPKKD